MNSVSRIDQTDLFPKPILRIVSSFAIRWSDGGPVFRNKVTGYSLTVTGENHDFQHGRQN